MSETYEPVRFIAVNGRLEPEHVLYIDGAPHIAAGGGPTASMFKHDVAAFFGESAAGADSSYDHPVSEYRVGLHPNGRVAIGTRGLDDNLILTNPEQPGVVSAKAAFKTDPSFLKGRPLFVVGADGPSLGHESLAAILGDIKDHYQRGYIGWSEQHLSPTAVIMTPSEGLQMNRAREVLTRFGLVNALGETALAGFAVWTTPSVGLDATDSYNGDAYTFLRGMLTFRS